VKYLAKIFCLGRNVSCMIIKLLLLLVVWCLSGCNKKASNP
jgi:hypothetical protein